ncbi:unnamed protein product, partial [Prorocentrum cordatum]
EAASGRPMGRGTPAQAVPQVLLAAPQGRTRFYETPALVLAEWRPLSPGLGGSGPAASSSGPGGGAASSVGAGCPPPAEAAAAGGPRREEGWSSADWGKLCSLAQTLETYEPGRMDMEELRDVLAQAREVRECLGRLERSALARLEHSQ